MADLLTHVLVAYVVGSLLAWRYEWFTPPLVTALMAGALLPDLVKIRMALPSETMSAVLGIPFSWGPLHNVGGLLVVIAIAVVLVPRAMRLPVLLAMSLGSFEHLFFDTFLYWPDGTASWLVWPIADQQLAIDGFYKSWDMVPLAITLGLVVFVLGVNWYRRSRSIDRPTPRIPESISVRNGDGAELPSTPTVSRDQYETSGVETGD